jgi:hypothetical protein
MSSIQTDETATGGAKEANVTAALRRAGAAHGEHEQRTGVRDETWPDWYAASMASEQAGAEPPR